MSIQPYLQLDTHFLRKVSLVYSLISFLILTGCHNEHDHEGLVTNREINEIIYETMRKEYLWYDELPSPQELDFDAEAEDFYYSLLSEKDGKNGFPYSTILPEEEYFTGQSYKGFGITYHSSLLVIQFVETNSSADKAGIQRGDIITAINGIKVNADNIKEILANCSTEALFTISRQGETTEQWKEFKVKLVRELIDTDPIYLDTVYTENKKRQIGYLYFHSEFAQGPDGDTTLYMNKLRQTFARFYQQNTKRLILDLRDNGGGSLNMCQLLCTMLAPQEAMGKKFMIVDRNELKQDEELFFDPNLIKTGAQLDLDQLVVIVSTTSASASELVIHCLRPYFKNKLMVVGTKTFGKNVGMSTLNNLDIPWTLIPITFYCKNSEEDSNYSDGLVPDVFATEDFTRKLYPIGDRREQLLKIAFQTLGED